MDGLRWSWIVSDGLSESVSFDLDYHRMVKTPKPISGWMDGWDGIGMDLRVGGGIEHLTVLIKETQETDRRRQQLQNLQKKKIDALSKTNDTKRYRKHF